MIDFLYPAALLLLLLIPALMAFFSLREAARQHALQQIGDPELVRRLLRRVSVLGRRTSTGLWLLAVSMVVVALARPVWGSISQTIFPVGAEVVFVVDVSLSMAAPDAPPSRLARAVLDVSELARLLPGTAFGLVVFAGVPVSYMPPTVDPTALDLFLNSLSADLVPVPGTSLAAALISAISLFDDNPQSPAMIVLLSDGEDHEGQIEVALLRLAEASIPVFALGYGTSQGSTIPTVNPLNQLPEFKRDSNGNLVVSSLRMSVLEDIAAATGGLALRASEPDALARLADLIRADQGAALQPQIVTRPNEVFAVPLLFAVLLLLLSLLQPTVSKAEPL